MKKRTYIFPAAAFLLELVSALFWVALRINHSGISKFLGADINPTFLIMNLPVMVCILSWIGAALGLIGLVAWKKRRWPAIAGFVIGLITAVGALVVIQFGAKDYLRFILVHFWKSLAVTGCILAFALILYFPIRGKNLLKTALVAAVVLAAVVIGYQLRPCDFTYGAVVYAVEDDYQIVFSTSDSAICWVEIDGECYYDLYAGSMRSVDRVHKVEVSQTVLDAAGGYKVCAKQMIYRGPFGGYTGETISQEYAFRPVDSSDGLRHVAISDVHEAVDAAICAATEQEDTDFIVLLGDLVSMVETEKDAQLANELAHGITGGEIPVIYARGNHEIKGEYSEVLYKYVGSKNQSYAYTVTLGDDDVFAVVLDMGEDHEDDWWEYYGTARFDLYRQEQSEMMEKILESGAHESYRYRMALCHIPIVFVDDEGLFAGFRKSWTELLNQMEIDICLSGHQHKLYQFLPSAVAPGETLVYASNYYDLGGKVEGSYLTDFNFPSFLVGRRSYTQQSGTQKDGFDAYVCFHTEADFEAGRQISNYVNSRGEIITGFYPFEGIYEYASFSDIETELKQREN
ncbi:MAG: metallophosphoesterase [Oscillospiraceae bacterium]|nr:metallophosphoesterase [Oscillospiraceae bacterium]